MKYSLLLGGKRARPYLVYITAQMLGIKAEFADSAAAAIECVHSYSLIHDDLPAMDNDDLRRGHATCHIKYDEATAILAGDALQTLAFEILANGQLSDDAETSRIDMIRVLSKASGASGMCMGQSLDLQAEGKKKLTLPLLSAFMRIKPERLLSVRFNSVLFALEIKAKPYFHS